MTLAGIAIIGFIGLTAMIILAASLNRTIADQRMQIEAMHRDNQSLMEALAKANGQTLQFKGVSPEPDPGINGEKRGTPPPYWQPKQERTVQIGEKTVTLKS